MNYMTIKDKTKTLKKYMECEEDIRDFAGIVRDKIIEQSQIRHCKLKCKVEKNIIYVDIFEPIFRVLCPLRDFSKYRIEIVFEKELELRFFVKYLLFGQIVTPLYISGIAIYYAKFGLIQVLFLSLFVCSIVYFEPLVKLRFFLKQVYNASITEFIRLKEISAFINNLGTEVTQSLSTDIKG